MGRRGRPPKNDGQPRVKHEPKIPIRKIMEMERLAKEQQAAAETRKDVTQNGEKKIDRRGKKRIEPPVPVLYEPLSKVPAKSPNGAYKDTTPEKAEQIANIVRSGITELQQATALPRIEKGDLQGIMERTFAYMERKAYEERLPNMEGLAVVLGISRNTLMDWRNDVKDQKVHRFLVAVTEQFSSMWAESTQSGLINPVAWIFYAKNHYGYVDKKEVDVSAKPVQEIQDESSIRNKWLADGGVIQEETEDE